MKLILLIFFYFFRIVNFIVVTVLISSRSILKENLKVKYSMNAELQGFDDCL
jgi:hypothetical protein